MTDTMLPVPLTLASRVDQVFPTLTAAQIARLAVHGQVRHVQRGEVLMEAGEQPSRFFVVTAGHMEIVRPSGSTEALVAVQDRPDISLVIADVVLPDMNGYDLAEEIIKMRPTMRVIFMSGFSADPLRRVVDAPCLAKPFTVEQLLSVVDEAMKGVS